MNEYSQDIEFWIRVLTFLIAVGGIVYTFFSNRRKDVDGKLNDQREHTDKRFETVEGRLRDGSKRMDQHDLQIHSLQKTVEAMPTKDDVHKIELGILEVAGNQKQMTALLEANKEFMNRLSVVSTRLEDYLLGNGGKP